MKVLCSIDTLARCGQCIVWVEESSQATELGGDACTSTNAEPSARHGQTRLHTRTSRILIYASPSPPLLVALDNMGL